MRTASAEEVTLNAPHHPHANAIEAFNVVLRQIKHEIKKSRHDWNKHEPKMWSRVAELSDEELTDFTIEKDLVQVRSGLVSYGTIILGKVRIPAVNDESGPGYVHVRCVGQPRPPATPVRCSRACQTYGRLSVSVVRSYFHMV